jgi:transcriptional regulator with XRE-family HTH domain
MFSGGMERWEPAARKLIGARVRELRDRRHWTIEKAAEVADLDRSYLAEIERGLRNPGLAVLLKVAGALGCRVGDLVPPEAEALPGSRQLS